MKIEKGRKEDIDEIEKMYDELNDYLADNTNYPGWKKGVYPVRQTAVSAILEENLYVARKEGRIVGSVILNHKPEAAYAEARWGIEIDYEKVFVLKTFVVHPQYFKQGLGKGLLDYIHNLAIKKNMKAIRLDVYESNIPAINLYEKNGFRYVGTVDLGIGETYNLKWFKLYEKLI